MVGLLAVAKHAFGRTALEMIIAATALAHSSEQSLIHATCSQVMLNCVIYAEPPLMRDFSWGNWQRENAAMLEGTRMISIRKRPAAPSFKLLVQCLLGLVFLLTIMAGSGTKAQTGDAAISGVTALDVAPHAASQGVGLLRQYRDGALKQAGNMGVTLLQEADWPNRFVIYEAWNDQA